MIGNRPLVAALAVLAIAALAAPAASAAPAVDGEFALTATPVHLTQGPDGNIWVAMTGGTDDVARVTPDGTVTGYDLPGVIGTNGITTGPDGNLWTTESGGVTRFAATNPTGGTNVPVAQISDPRPIVTGPDGNLWTVSNDKVIQITTAGVATPTTVTGMIGHDIVRGGDGNLYIADGSGRVLGLTTASPSTPTPYATGGNLQGVAAGPGAQIAFTDPVNAPEQIGRITPGNPTPMLTDQPNIDPTGIAFGADGAYWIANFNSTSLTRFTPDGQVTSLPGLSASSGARYIATGPGHTLWVGLETAQKVARVTGVEPPPGPGPQPQPGSRPGLSRLSLTKRLHAGASTTIRVALSEAATLTLRFDRALPGRRTKAGRCVAPSRRLRRARRCTRYVKVGSVTRHARAGVVKIRFTGRVGRHRLAVGSYRLTITATDAAGHVSRPVRASFAIVASKHTAKR